MLQYCALPMPINVIWPLRHDTRATVVLRPALTQPRSLSQAPLACLGWGSLICSATVGAIVGGKFAHSAPCLQARVILCTALGATLVTSQFPVEHWHEVLGDPT